MTKCMHACRILTEVVDLADRLADWLNSFICAHSARHSIRIYSRASSQPTKWRILSTTNCIYRQNMQYCLKN